MIRKITHIRQDRHSASQELISTRFVVSSHIILRPEELSTLGILCRRPAGAAINMDKIEVIIVTNSRSLSFSIITSGLKAAASPVSQSHTATNNHCPPVKNNTCTRKGRFNSCTERK